MTSKIYVLGLEESTSITFEGRFGSALKNQFIATLIEVRPPTKNTNRSIIADDLGIIIDKVTRTSIQTKARVFINGESRRAASTPLEIGKGELAELHIRGYGQPLKENAVIGLKNI